MIFFSNKYSRSTLIYLIVKIFIPYLAGIHLVYLCFPPIWRGLENISSIVYTYSETLVFGHPIKYTKVTLYVV